MLPLATYHGDPRYGGDLHRAELAWAVHAARGGWDRERLIRKLLEGRDLAKKGDHARQLAYATRTAEKALAEVGLE